MGTLRRRSRHLLPQRDPLLSAWKDLQPPPEWAYEPGEHHEDLVDLYFFGLDGQPQTNISNHPYRWEWLAAMKASNPERINR